MDLLSALRPLECLEHELDMLYEQLAARFAEDEEASRFFARLSFDEKSHVQDIQFLRRLARQNPADFAGFPLELPALEVELRDVRGFRDRADEVTVDEALQFTTRIELGAAETHSRSARTQAHPAVAKLLDGLSKADYRHLELVRSFAAARGRSVEGS